MDESAIILMVIDELRRNGYADVPPTAISLEVQQALTRLGYAIARSDSMWIDGWRLYSPRAVREGLYRPYIPRSAGSRSVTLDARAPSLAEIEDIEESELSVEDLIDVHKKLRVD